MCCRYTTTPKCRPGVCVSIVCGPCDCSSVSVVALRVELSATRLSAGFGQPALDYHVPTSLSTKSGWRDSNPRSRAPNDHAAHGARRAAAALHPVIQSERADLNRGHRRAAVVSPHPLRGTRRDTQASLRSVSSSCGSRTRLCALKGRDPKPIDERAISAHTVHAVDTFGQRHRSRSGSGGARIRVPWSSARCYTISATDPTKKPDVVMTPGFGYSSGKVRPGVTSEMDRTGYSPIDRRMYPSLFALRNSGVLKSWLSLG